MHDRSEFHRYLAEFSEFVPALREDQVRLLDAHYAKLRAWMGKMNLTTITNPREMVLRHYVESLWLGARVPEWVRTLADAGSGAGFPGVPVAVLRQDVQVNLVEADRRKGVFLQESTLDAQNIKVCSIRLEEWNGDLDAVIGRGVRVEEILEFARGNAKWCGVLTSGEIAGKFGWDAVEQLPWDMEHVAAFLKVPREIP